MMTLMAILTIKIMKMSHPMTLAFAIMGLSIMMALAMFKTSLISWMAFVVIMIFSSGMMTLFIYASSLTPNEKSKSGTPWLLVPLALVSGNLLSTSTKQSKQAMKIFSSQIIIFLMIAILLLTMVTISLQSFNPQQSLSSTF